MSLFGKNVLSQYLRTKCDKQLRLSLYTPEELTNMNWPVPLTARPTVQILRDAGNEWEQAKMADLESAFGNNIIANKQNRKFKEVELLPLLQQNLPSPTFILQPNFTHPELKNAFLQAIGIDPASIAQIPAFRAFRPDIIWVKTRSDDEVEILPNGETRIIDPTDQRKALLIFDIKHAGEANSSYSSEITLYAVLLANWLRLVNLHGTYLVSSRMALWTRAKEISELSQLVATNPGATISEKEAVFWHDLELVDFQIFFQTIDHFFKTDLPRVLSLADWAQLDWHVDSRCSACDFLGYRNWLVAGDRTILDTHRDRYCVPAAEDTQHLSRIVTITRGGRRILQSNGHSSITAVSALLPTDQVFDQHNALKADRKHLPHRAASLIAGGFTLAPGTTTIDFPKWANLEIFITVNFDPGTGLLTSLGSEARFRQRVPFGQQSTVRQAWQSEAQTLLAPTLTEELNVLISFLSRLANIFSFVNDIDPQRGGTLAAQTQIQIYFWDRRQFEELAKAIGRHLNAIVMPQNQRFLQGLVWLFPPEQVLQEDEIMLANPITFQKTVIQRDLRLPVAHCLTLFNVAEVYYEEQFRTYIPGSFYRDPFSDMIPRERIYEIWSSEPLIRLGNTQKTRSQCITDFSETVQRQVTALRNIVWKFRTDMQGRLNFTARSLDIGIPFNFQNMSEDGRLWYGWARLEEAFHKVELRRMWSAEPEELEASYDILRFSRLLGEGSNNELVYEVLPSSRDCKFRDGEDFLALQDERRAGFLDLRVRDILPAARDQLSFQDQNTKMSKIFEANLIEYDRLNHRARIRLSNFGTAPTLRQFLITNGAVDLSASMSLVPAGGPPLSDRIRECLISIGRPPIAVADPATYQALGHITGNNPPGNDPLTFAGRVLWDAAALAVESTNISNVVTQNAIQAIQNVRWDFNTSQREAVEHCLNNRLSVVWGPPGTGKTTTAAALIAARILIAQAANQNLRLLITGPTYTAWEKLFNEALALLQRLNIANVGCFRVYSKSRVSRTPLHNNHLQVVDAEANNNDPNFNTLIQNLQTPNRIVLVGAVAQQCYRIAKQSQQIARYPYFDFAAIDESSQLDIGKALFPLCLLSNDAEISFFGDHLQLPPVISTQPPLNAEWLVGSIQTYLRTRHACPTQPLLINYRAAQPFISFCKRIGYPESLTAHSPDLCLHLLNDGMIQPPQWNTTVPWFAELGNIIASQNRLIALTYADGRAGQANDFEADLVCGIVQQLFLSVSRSLDNELDDNGQITTPQHTLQSPDSFWENGLGIVTPHRAQRALIVSRLRQIFPAHPVDKIDAAVDTVERFQGGQRDVIIISFGVGDPDLVADEESFLLQLERTNVAISRARAKCILVISDDLAYHLPSDRKTIQTSKAIKTYVSNFCRRVTTFDVPFGGNNRQLVFRCAHP